MLLLARSSFTCSSTYWMAVFRLATMHLINKTKKQIISCTSSTIYAMYSLGNLATDANALAGVSTAPSLADTRHHLLGARTRKRRYVDNTVWMGNTHEHMPCPQEFAGWQDISERLRLWTGLHEHAVCGLCIGYVQGQHRRACLYHVWFGVHEPARRPRRAGVPVRGGILQVERVHAVRGRHIQATYREHGLCAVSGEQHESGDCYQLWPVRLLCRIRPANWLL